MRRRSASRARAARRVHVAVDSTPTARTGPTPKGSHLGRNEFQSILGTVFRGGPLSCYDGLFITGVDGQAALGIFVFLPGDTLRNPLDLLSGSWIETPGLLDAPGSHPRSPSAGPNTATSMSALAATPHLQSRPPQPLRIARSSTPFSFPSGHCQPNGTTRSAPPPRLTRGIAIGGRHVGKLRATCRSFAIWRG